MNLPEKRKKEVILVIGKETVRIKNNNKIAKYVRRNYGLDKHVAKGFLKAGFKEGEIETTVDSVLEVLSTLKTRKERSWKKISEKVDLSSELEAEVSKDGIDTSNRARRFYKKKIKEEVGDEVHCHVEKVKPNKVVKLVVTSEVKTEETPDFDEFF